MAFYGTTSTWKIVYSPKNPNGGQYGVALIEACDHHHAMYTFQQEYAGEYFTIQSCKKLFE
jgi:hypothetical protein